MRRVAVFRPEPGNRATVAALERAGLAAIALPLFEVVPIAWTPPDPAGHDGLLLTSANAVRCAGPGLAALSMLPVLAVGEATARAARDAGLDVIATGSDGVEAIMHHAAELRRHRLLHLAGQHRATPSAGVAAVVAVYRSRKIEREPADLLPVEGQVAMLHSPRAAHRFAALASAIDRASVRLAALSPAVAAAAGTGWETIAVAPSRDDTALVALARRLAD